MRRSRRRADRGVHRYREARRTNAYYDQCANRTPYPHVTTFFAEPRPRLGARAYLPAVAIGTETEGPAAHRTSRLVSSSGGSKRERRRPYFGSLHWRAYAGTVRRDRLSWSRHLRQGVWKNRFGKRRSSDATKRYAAVQAQEEAPPRGVTRPALGAWRVDTYLVATHSASRVSRERVVSPGSFARVERRSPHR